MLNFRNSTNDKLTKVAHIFTKPFSSGLFLAIGTRTPNMVLLQPNKNVLVHRTECPDVGQASGDLIQWFQLYLSAITPMFSAFVFSLCSLSQAGSKREQNFQAPRVPNTTTAGR